MSNCFALAYGFVWIILTISSMISVIVGSVCIHTECFISQNTSLLYLWFGLGIFILLLLVGVYSLYKYKRIQDYVEI